MTVEPDFLTFLPLEPDICLARILSFGYNADFVSTGNVCNAILDFAKNLLYDLKYSTDEETKSLNIGHVRKFQVMIGRSTLRSTIGSSYVRRPQYGRAHRQGSKKTLLFGISG